MSIDDLIKNYKTQWFSIEQSISHEEDNLLKYQLKRMKMRLMHVVKG